MAAFFLNFYLFFIIVSLWGKLSEDQRKEKTVYLSSDQQKEFNELLMDREKTLVNFNIITDNLIGLTYKCSERTTPISYKTNEITAGYVSAMGRLLLHDLLLACENSQTTRCLYYDTDSIFAVVKNGHEPPFPPDNDELGQLASELEEGEFIENFVSLGAKNYAFSTTHGNISVHVRGFTMSLNDVNKKINFSSMKDLLLKFLIHNEEATITTSDEHKIVRQKNKRRLVTVKQNRQYCFKYIKQKICRDTLSVRPYGY